QYYRFLAHDPFLRHGTATDLDTPIDRSRRILVPLLAWALAGSQQGAIDGAYGLVFLAVPATIVGVDTMTVDITLAALTACFAWHWGSGREPGWGLWFTLAA